MAIVYLVEDNEPLARLVQMVLHDAGIAVTHFGDGQTAKDALEQTVPDLVILDLKLPRVTGSELCRWMRSRADLADVPVVAITASMDSQDRYMLFQEGVDDFLTKPFDSFELLLRVRNRLKRAQKTAERGPRALRVGDVLLDLDTLDLRAGSRSCRLTQSEFAILRFLMERPDKPVDVETLLTQALGYPPRQGNPEIVRTHVKHLRAKIEDDPSEPTRVVTLHGLGYMIKAEVVQPAEALSAVS